MSIILNGTTGISTNISLPAGTTTAAPMTMTSGTNLTTATAGALEYNGKSLLFTPQGTQRGVVPGMQFYMINSGVVGANATGNQNALGLTNGVTLSASTIYAFEANFYLAKSAGTTGHTIAIGFAGTATLNYSYMVYNAINTSNGSLATNAPVGNFFSPSSLPNTFVASGNITAAAYSSTVTIKGTVSVNAGGNFNPVYALSSAPGGAYTTQAGSYMLIYPIGASGANVSVGSWS